jgi:hypothetical protein
LGANQAIAIESYSTSCVRPGSLRQGGRVRVRMHPYSGVLCGPPPSLTTTTKPGRSLYLPERIVADVRIGSPTWKVWRSVTGVLPDRAARGRAGVGIARGMSLGCSFVWPGAPSFASGAGCPGGCGLVFEDGAVPEAPGAEVAHLFSFIIWSRSAIDPSNPVGRLACRRR